jgi:hypothetical protein
MMAHEARIAISVNVHSPLEPGDVRVSSANVLGLRRGGCQQTARKGGCRPGQATQTSTLGEARKGGLPLRAESCGVWQGRACRCCSWLLMLKRSEACGSSAVRKRKTRRRTPRSCRGLRACILATERSPAGRKRRTRKERRGVGLSRAQRPRSRGLTERGVLWTRKAACPTDTRRLHCPCELAFLAPFRSLA